MKGYASEKGNGSFVFLSVSPGDGRSKVWLLRKEVVPSPERCL